MVRPSFVLARFDCIVCMCCLRAAVDLYTYTTRDRRDLLVAHHNVVMHLNLIDLIKDASLASFVHLGKRHRPATGKDRLGRVRMAMGRVEQHQIHIHIHEDSLCPPMKKSTGEKLCPCPNLMDIHIYWISIGSSRGI